MPRSFVDSGSRLRANLALARSGRDDARLAQLDDVLLVVACGRRARGDALVRARQLLVDELREGLDGLCATDEATVDEESGRAVHGQLLQDAHVVRELGLAGLARLVGQEALVVE